MQCQRCQGLVVPVLVGTRQGALWAGRCVNCGDVMDPVILRNRLAGPGGGTKPGRRSARLPTGPVRRRARSTVG